MRLAFLYLVNILSAVLSVQTTQFEYIQALPPPPSWSGNITFFTNGGDLRRPLIPGRGPEVTLIPSRAPVQAIPVGPFGHHLLNLVQSFWRHADNNPLSQQKYLRDDDFPNILTQITPKPGSQYFTPLNLAKGFNSMARQQFYNAEFNALHFRWFYRDEYAGTTKTAILAPSNGADLKLTELIINDPWSNSTLGAAPVRTRFTGIGLAPGQVLILVRELLTQIWQNAAMAQVETNPTNPRTITIQLPDRVHVWKLRLVLVASTLGGGQAVSYSDISNRVLRMLQYPAYLDRWETLISDFFIGTENIASLSIYRENRSTRVTVHNNSYPDMGEISSGAAS